MKKLFNHVLIAAIVTAGLGGFTTTVFGQADAGPAGQFLDQAKSATDSQLAPIATDLTGKVQSLESVVGGAAAKSKLDGVLKSLTGGMDSEALTSAFSLVKSAKLTPEQLDLAKQVGNLTSAYVVQKNFSSLDGAKGDVATIVNSLRAGKIKDLLAPLKNIASNAKLTDTQKQLVTTIADKYAPGLSKVTGAADKLKKLPGF